jgi:hypothetical protein
LCVDHRQHYILRNIADLETRVEVGDFICDLGKLPRRHLLHYIRWVIGQAFLEE